MPGARAHSRRCFSRAARPSPRRHQQRRLVRGTAVTFTDVLGDRQFNFFAASVSQYRQFLDPTSTSPGAGSGRSRVLPPPTSTTPESGQLYDTAWDSSTETTPSQTLRRRRQRRSRLYPFSRYRLPWKSNGSLASFEEVRRPAAPAVCLDTGGGVRAPSSGTAGPPPWARPSSRNDRLPRVRTAVGHTIRVAYEASPARITTS